jgi:hypothetical protein
MEDEKIVKLRRTLSEATPVKPKASRLKLVPSQTIEGDGNIQAGGDKVARQSIKGNGNVQVAGSVGNMTIRTVKGPKIEMTAPFGSIGANPAFRARIEGLIKQINDYRYQRLGKAFKFAAVVFDLCVDADFAPLAASDNPSAKPLISLSAETPSTHKSNTTFAALYGDLAKAFGLDPKNWKDIWMFDESRAAEVIPWLEDKLNNTQR